MDPDSDPLAVSIINQILVKEISFAAIAGIVVVIILIIISGMVSASEVAYFSLSPQKINTLRKVSNKRNKRVLALLERPKKLLATILIANNFVNVGLVIISAFVINSLFDFTQAPVWGFLIQVVVITFIILLFGEILPKIYASAKNLAYARFISLPLKAVDWFLSPISLPLAGSTRIVDRKFERKKKNVSLSDLSDALELTDDPDLKEDEKILKGIVSFGSTDVREIMASRVEVVGVEINYSLNKLLSVIIESGFSRIPVFDDSLDNIKGLLYTKDLLPHYHKGDNFKWQTLIRPAYFVPESKKINDLLEEFRKKKMHMAVVIDEYGGTSGIVTLEDVLEEIVGEISDETDNVEKIYEKNEDGAYVIEGRMLLNDFFKLFDVNDNYFDDIRGDSDTLAGLILVIKSEMPAKNEIIKYKNFIFKIKSVDDRRIKQIIVTLEKNS